jgi:hypothetical protein
MSFSSGGKGFMIDTRLANFWTVVIQLELKDHVLHELKSASHEIENQYFVHNLSGVSAMYWIPFHIQHAISNVSQSSKIDHELDHQVQLYT